MALLTGQTSNTTGLSYYTSTRRSCQTFTMPAGYDTIEYVTLLLREAGTMPGNYSVAIYATSGGLPTGSALTSTTLTSGSIPSSYDWVTFNFADITVTPGAKYAIVTSQTSTTSISNSTYWGHADGASYSGGGSYYSTTSGSTWSNLSGDFAFRVYGVQSASAPSVTTGTAGTPTLTSVVISSNNVTSDGGATILERGVVYSTTDSTPDTGDSKVTTTGTTGTYNITLSSLLPGTSYYASAFARNSQGTSYGNVITFNTDTDIPSVTTGSASSITSTSATLAGNVTSANGATVTERGVVYGASADPTTEDNKLASGSGTGSFTATASGLTPNSTIHYRAYAINSDGTAYGTDATFATKDTVQKWAQKFQATETGVLTSVSLYLKLVYGTSGIAKVRIYSDNSGEPGTLLYTCSDKTVTNTSYRAINFTTNVDITNTSYYWIVLETPYSVGNYHIKLGANTDGGYADGAIKYILSSATTTWVAVATTQSAFVVAQQPTLSVDYDIEVKYKKKYL